MTGSSSARHLRPAADRIRPLNLTYTVMSKRRLLELVKEKRVSGWDDPRMPTICGLRRRGYTPEAIRAFCKESASRRSTARSTCRFWRTPLREDLNRRAPRVMAVLRPLQVVIENYPEGQSEELDAVNNPEDAATGTRRCRFPASSTSSRRLPRGPAERILPPRPRPRSAAALRLLHQVRGRRQGRGRRNGRAPLHLRSRHPRRQRARRPQGQGDDPLGLGRARRRRGGAALRSPLRQGGSGRRARGQDYKSNLNPNSLEVVNPAYVEPSLKDAPPGYRYQFERLGYFCVDSRDSKPGKPVFNRTVTLKDTWAKIEKKGKGK